MLTACCADRFAAIKVTSVGLKERECTEHVCCAGPLQALSAHLPADNTAQAAHTEEILKQLRQMQEQVSPPVLLVLLLLVLL